jgi:hypothetical protein
MLAAEALISTSKTVAPMLPSVTAVFKARHVFPGDPFPPVKATISHIVNNPPFGKENLKVAPDLY